MTELQDYRYRGARALVLLHERHLTHFLERWREVKAAGVTLPQTDDPSYESMDTLLFHVMRAARNYMAWICDKLELPDPDLPQLPAAGEIEASADDYLEELLEMWRQPLRDLPPERLGGRTFATRWGQEYTVEAMLEHAVMHPIRHAFQLDELVGKEAEGRRVERR